MLGNQSNALFQKLPNCRLWNGLR